MWLCEYAGVDSDNLIQCAPKDCLDCLLLLQIVILTDTMCPLHIYEIKQIWNFTKENLCSTAKLNFNKLYYAIELKNIMELCS